MDPHLSRVFKPSSIHIGVRDRFKSCAQQYVFERVVGDCRAGYVFVTTGEPDIWSGSWLDASTLKWFEAMVKDFNGPLLISV
jgi:hypothetical protein